MNLFFPHSNAEETLQTINEKDKMKRRNRAKDTENKIKKK